MSLRRLPIPLLVALAALTSAFLPAARAATPTRDMFGLNAQRVFKNELRADAALHVEAMALTGIGVVRRDAFWSDAEPIAPVDGVHTYRWARHDEVVTLLAGKNLRWYPILDYGTTWAASETGPRAWMSPPVNAEDFAAYAGAFARRYGRGGEFWREHPELPYLPIEDYEVWNEPNVARFWPDQANAGARYAELYWQTHRALRAVDPSAGVVVGGLGSVGLESFLTKMLDARPELAQLVDAVGFHPYGSATALTYGRIAEARRVVDALFGRHVPLEITEFGVAVPPATEARRAEFVKRVVVDLANSDCGVTRIVPHTWTTDEASPGDPEQWFGIANHDGSFKPTAWSFAEGITEALSASDPVPRLICGDARPTADVAGPSPDRAATAPVTADAPPTQPLVQPAAARALPRLPTEGSQQAPDAVRTTTSGERPRTDGVQVFRAGARKPLVVRGRARIQRRGSKRYVVADIVCSTACTPSFRLARRVHKSPGRPRLRHRLRVRAPRKLPKAIRVVARGVGLTRRATIVVPRRSKRS